MADFELSARATLDASGFQAGAATVEKGLDDVGRAEQRTGKSASELARETRAAEQAQRQLDKAAAELRNRLDPVAAAQERLNAELREAKTLFDTGRISAEQYSRATTLLQKGQLAGVQSAGAMRSANAQLGFQIQDVTQQAALGTNAFVILAQQGGQVASALSGAKGVVGSLATALAGPVGSLVIAGVAVVGMLLTMKDKTDDASKAKKGFTDASDAAKMSSDELTKAIDDQNKALGRSLQSSRDAERQALRSADAFLVEATKRRESTRAALEYAIALQQANIARASGPSSSADMAALGLARGNERIAEIRAQLAEVETRERNAQSGVAMARLKLLQRNVEEAATPEGKANRLLEQQTKNLNQQYAARLKAGANAADVDRAYQAALLRATKERDAEVERIRDREREANKRPAKAKVDPNTGDLTDFLRPVSGVVTGRFGENRGSHNHAGVDLRAAVGTPILAAADGIVKIAKIVGAYGNLVEIGHGRGTDTRYGHLSRFNVTEGQRVARGDVIGFSGGEPGTPGAGRSSAAHLHYEVRRGGKAVDPLKGRFATDPVDVAEAADKAKERLAREQDRRDNAERQRIAALTRDYEALGRQLDPVIQAQNEFADQLERINRLSEAGQLGSYFADVGDGVKFLVLGAEALELVAKAGDKLKDAKDKALQRQGDEIFGPDAEKDFRSMMDRIGDDLARKGPIFGAEAAEKIRDGMIDAAQAVANAVGGKIGDGLGALIEIANDVIAAARGTYQAGENAAQSRSPIARAASSLQRLTKDFQSTKEEGSKSHAKLGKIAEGLGKIGDGAARGDQIASVAKALGFNKFSRTGSQIGGAVGSFLPIPFGREIGAVVGGTIGSFFKKTPSGTVVLGNGTSSTSGKLGGALGQVGGGIQGALGSIAEQLGAEVGNYLVSIGKRGDTFRVSSSGASNVDTKKSRNISGLIYEGKDEAAATMAALRDAIADGAIVGLSAAMQRALQSSPDIDKGVREALKVRDVEELISGMGDKLSRTFRDFDKVAAERVRIARQYGLDLIKVEKANAEERAELLKNAIASRIGSLLDFQNEMKFGDLFEGDAMTRRAAILGQIGTTQSRAEAGAEGAADELVQLYRRLIGTSEEAFGTAGPELAADRAAAAAGIERVIKMENDRIAAAQAQAVEQLGALKQGNELAGETNDLLARTNYKLDVIAGQLGGGGFGDGGGGSTWRHVALN